MKKLILASFIAVATAASFSIPAQADSIVIRTDHHMHRDHNDRMHMRRHHEHCRTRVETHWRHHHRVMEKVTVCN